MTQSVDELLAAARKEKPKTQDESNKIIIETIEKMSPEDSITIHLESYINAGSQTSCLNDGMRHMVGAF